MSTSTVCIIKSCLLSGVFGDNENYNDIDNMHYTRLLSSARKINSDQKSYLNSLKWLEKQYPTPHKYYQELCEYVLAFEQGMLQLKFQVYWTRHNDEEEEEDNTRCFQPPPSPPPRVTPSPVYCPFVPSDSEDDCYMDYSEEMELRRTQEVIKQENQQKRKRTRTTSQRKTMIKESSENYKKLKLIPTTHTN